MSGSTNEFWYRLHSGLCHPAFNMALDEALLNLMPRLQRPVLRFYGWTEPAASFGYFQKYADVERATLLRPLVRRPTGGGIVQHGAGIGARDEQAVGKIGAVGIGLADDRKAHGGSNLDLRALVEELVDRGVDGLAAAGGDGTQAIVASVAAERDVPFACIPAGTRNHFALDLGVDRDDVVGALDAFVNGGERVVDLAEVNGRTFVNNCSVGVYAEAVQRNEYRDAKLRTLLTTATQALGPSEEVDLDYAWFGADGERESGAAVILVSNNVYRLGKAIGSGTRPRMDAGTLGIGVLRAPGSADGQPTRPLWSTWSAAEFGVEAHGSVNVGVDGEAMTLPAPLQFSVRPRALRVRIAHRHPGASPSAVQPETISATIALLWRMARGHSIEGLR